MALDKLPNFLLIGFYVLVLLHSGFSYWSCEPDQVGQLSGQLL